MKLLKKYDACRLECKNMSFELQDREVENLIISLFVCVPLIWLSVSFLLVQGYYRLWTKTNGIHKFHKLAQMTNKYLETCMKKTNDKFWKRKINQYIVWIIILTWVTYLSYAWVFKFRAERGLCKTISGSDPKCVNLLRVI